jgi:hypothetical protein
MARLFVHNLRGAFRGIFRATPRVVALVGAFVVASFAGARAQTAPERVELWTIGFLRKPVNDALLVQFDAQFRRQSAPRAADLLQFPALWSVRSWIWYKFDERWQAIVQPFGYFQHTALSLASAAQSTTRRDVLERRFDEARFAFGAAYSARFEETGASLRLWALTESRFFQPFSDEMWFGQRARFQAQFRAPLSDSAPFAVQISNEVFVNPALAARGLTNQLYDQNRTIAGIVWTPSPKCEYFLSAQHIHQRNQTVMPSGDEYIRRWTVFFLASWTF